MEPVFWWAIGGTLFFILLIYLAYKTPLLADAIVVILEIITTFFTKG